MVVLLLQGCKVMLLGVLLLDKQGWSVCGFMGAASLRVAVLLQCNAASELRNQELNSGSQLAIVTANPASSFNTP